MAAPWERPQPARPALESAAALALSRSPSPRMSIVPTRGRRYSPRCAIYVRTNRPRAEDTRGVWRVQSTMVQSEIITALPANNISASAVKNAEERSAGRRILNIINRAFLEFSLSVQSNCPSKHLRTCSGGTASSHCLNLRPLNVTFELKLDCKVGPRPHVLKASF